MNTHVRLDRLKNLKVLWAVIVALLIHVVNQFCRKKPSPDLLLGHKPTSPDVSIAMSVRVIGSANQDIAVLHFLTARPAVRCVAARLHFLTVVLDELVTRLGDCMSAAARAER